MLSTDMLLALIATLDGTVAERVRLTMADIDKRAAVRAAQAGIPSVIVEMVRLQLVEALAVGYREALRDVRDLVNGKAHVNGQGVQ